ncbi:MAG TPA: HEPN domain-containing protein [Saprospiraceae bacterium]|nr:HEPN domain-containing protein [Saprospiraceae bacterium]HRK82503.1 HEPN domain-containing protein [Saprospiraceae bacterium]
MDEKLQRILNEAEQAISDAEFNLQGERCHVVANRTYYAVFHCIQALLHSEGLFVKPHQGAQQKFHQLFIKTGKIPVEAGETLAYLAELRTLSDYDYGSTITTQQAQKAIEMAAAFMETTRSFFT